MGLDTTHNAFHGAYSAFMRFRKGLVDHSLKTDVMNFNGFGGTVPEETIENPGLQRLIHQSDCDGEISPDDCKLIADYLETIIPELSEGELKDRSIQFRDGCLLAHSKSEFIEFG
ncbi:hypothetical protein [Sphingobacterium sp. UBA6320]|uniref:hypothetical protein n=1 Tax=Sphingobacterium sp. UBA6320 TaxID=1947510 RepID=UPI0025FEFCD4|nr:hypothetical protein [Sphingobacterium sp. UBA6320]